MLSELINIYKQKQKEIESHLQKFKSLKKDKYFDEFIFCLLTPQSNAQRCWQAVLEIKKLRQYNKEKISEILSNRTRFHNNKASYIMNALKIWNKISTLLNNTNRVKLRNLLAENVKGYGLKEASHFLRNIGKSENQIAILDRHILKNLKYFKIINETKIKSKSQYLQIEQAFLNFSKTVDIPIDHLDILWWSQENGEIFK